MRFQTLPRLGLLSLALLATAAQAQTVLTPGHPDLMTAGLALDSQIMAVRIAGPPAEDAGTMRYAVARDGGTVTLVTTADARRIGQEGEMTTTFAWPSLRPILRQPAEDAAQNTTRYDGARVSGAYSRGEWAPLPFDITLESAPFQPEALPFVARALPFRAGYTGTVPTFTAGNRLREYTMTVVGQEDFERADGTTASTWVVEQEGEGRGARTERYFVDATTRDLVATSYTNQGTTVVIEPTTQEALDMAAQARSMMTALRPGSDALAVDALQSYSQSYVVKLVQPQQQDIGTQSRTITVDRAAGTVTVVDSTEVPLAGQKTSSTLVMAYPSLLPLSSRSENGDVVTNLTYNDDGVIRRQTPTDDESPDYERAFEEPIFDPSALFEVVRLLPFADGYTAALQSFDSDGPTRIVLAVTGRDEVEGQSVWLVTATPDGTPPFEFAIDAATRELVRIKIAPQPGVEIEFVRADG